MVREFPSGPVVRTPDFYCRGHKFNPWLGNWTAQAMWPIKKDAGFERISSKHLVLGVKKKQAGRQKPLLKRLGKEKTGPHTQKKGNHKIRGTHSPSFCHPNKEKYGKVFTLCHTDRGKTCKIQFSPVDYLIGLHYY